MIPRQSRAATPGKLTNGQEPLTEEQGGAAILRPDAGAIAVGRCLMLLSCRDMCQCRALASTEQCDHGTRKQMSSQR